MKKQFFTDERVIEYVLRKSVRARRMRLAVHMNGSVVLTMPFHAHESIAERFLREKTPWLLSKISFFEQCEGYAVMRCSAADRRKHTDAAYAYANERIAHFNAVYRFPFTRITIRDQKTRWGSCSRKGALSFNIRIALLPQRLADYIIVHELCHCGEFNHSKKFWHLVAQTIPDHADRRKELKRHRIYFQ